MDGSEGVSCQVGGSSNNDVKLGLTFPPRVKGTPRAFWVDLSDPVNGGPIGAFHDGSYLIVQDIAGMPVGSAMTAHAHFRFNSASWFVNWCGGTCLNFPGISDAVWVSHPGIGGRRYAVTTDGKRFLVDMPVGGSAPASLTVVTNWQASTRKWHPKESERQRHEPRATHPAVARDQRRPVDDARRGNDFVCAVAREVE